MFRNTIRSAAPPRDAAQRAEAIHLVRRAARGPPTLRLLTLPPLTEAAQPACGGALGRLVPLDEQDRSLWAICGGPSLGRVKRQRSNAYGSH